MAGGSQDVRRFMDREATPPRGHGSARYPPEQERSPSPPPPLPTKRRKYQRVGSGSSEENVVPVDSPPKKKQARKTKHVTKVDPDEEMPQEEAVIVGVGFSQPPVLLKEGKDGKRIVEPATPGVLNVRNPLSLPLVSSWEKGMDTMNVMMERYRVDSGLRDAYKLMPEQTEIFQKMCQTWMNEEARGLQLTLQQATHDGAKALLGGEGQLQTAGSRTRTGSAPAVPCGTTAAPRWKASSSVCMGR